MIIGGLSVNNNWKHKVKGVVDFFLFFLSRLDCVYGVQFNVLNVR